MKLAFIPRAWEQYLYWQGQDRATLRRINRLIDDVLRSPFEGIGKPEALKHLGADIWSRRIDEQNRLVYLVGDETVTIIQVRYHY
ncbi:MAG: toxin YoeB [Actinomycetota bacterium]|nr:toxin YoeB [Actinomycetota bacterium]